VSLAGSPFRRQNIIQGYRADRRHAQTVYWLAIGLALVAVFQLIPALMQGSPAAAPSWAALVWLMVIGQLGFAAWMACAPDWSTVWVCMVMTAVVAALYSLALALVMVTPTTSVVWFELEDVRDSAGLWCGSVVLLVFLMAYTCSRVGHLWQKSYQAA
jgi:hypothetical protein